MKSLIPCVVALLVGFAAGFGVSYLVTQGQQEQMQTKVDDLQAQVDDLQKKLQVSKAESDRIIRKASEELAKSQKNFTRLQNILKNVNIELTRTKAELATLKGSDQPSLNIATPTATQTAPAKATTTTAARSSSTVPTKVYTVKEGDSLWKIAANELGEGFRFREILDLNPNISENQTLKVGSKLKIPTR